MLSDELREMGFNRTADAMSECEKFLIEEVVARRVATQARATHWFCAGIVVIVMLAWAYDAHRAHQNVNDTLSLWNDRILQQDKDIHDLQNRWSPRQLDAQVRALKNWSYDVNDDLDMLMLHAQIVAPPLDIRRRNVEPLP